VRLLILGGGSAIVAALAALAVSRVPLGTPLFYAFAAVPCVVYALLLPRLLAGANASRRLLRIALLFAVLFRVPLALAPVGADNDMVRYLYDGRVQRLGLNPFTIVPADPALAWTHTDETRRMPSIRARTPYPAAAQLFFRLVASIRETPRAMKVALVLCDLLTIVVLLQWLRETDRSPWLALAYAWNPLVILEVAHSGHIDALGALSIAVSAWMLGTGRGMRAAGAFVIAVATKLLPIVLVPLYWRRVRLRDVAAGAALLVACYLPFVSAGTVALGNVPNVVAGIRFNGPVFHTLARDLTPSLAAAFAVGIGLALAVWMRLTRPANAADAWAWPMAASVACAPVIYPWYLLYFTPFLFTRRTIPLVVWTYSILPVYLVWTVQTYRGPWVAPTWVLLIEYGSVALALGFMIVLRRRREAA
jgi:alpha-1,6-mannosyltransferase